MEGECDFCGLWWSEKSGGIVGGACPVCRERYISDEAMNRDLQRMVEDDGAGLGVC